MSQPPLESLSCRLQDSETSCGDDGSIADSISSSVSSWLESHPSHPSLYIHEDTPSQSKPKSSRKSGEEYQGRKRRRLSLQGATGKRVRLQELSINMASTPSRDGDPSKKPTVRSLLNDGDDFDTPKASSTGDVQLRDLPMGLPPPSPTPAPRGSVSPDRLSHTSGKTLSTNSASSASGLGKRKLGEEEGSSTASKRGRMSPTKLDRMLDLQQSDTKAKYKDFDTPGYPVPSEMQTLKRDMQFLGEGVGVLPSALQNLTVAGIENALPHKYMHPETWPDIPAITAFHQQVLELVDRARESANLELSEPSWNTEVVAPLLRLALTGDWNEHVWYRDVTVAKITDPTLLPKSASGGYLQSKMVDYALVLNRYAEGEFHDRIAAKLWADQAQARAKDIKKSINHTDTEYMCFSPIVISMETKKGLISEGELRVQLALWVSAHFKRLSQLCPGATLLPLPLLSTQGHEWKLMLACPRDGNFYILRDIELGATRGAIGIYSIIAALRRLAKWTIDDYIPWFEKNILRDHPAQGGGDETLAHTDASAQGDIVAQGQVQCGT
ncbi:hypothetical protein MMC21_007611 [Puttea exsequens]|nr:hypothetical protein [Puttea exsequens]